jgi:hypothetical protein
MTTSTGHGAYDMLISLRDKMTRLNGLITPEAVDKLEDEIGGIFTVAKTHHYDQGQKYGHLASAIPEAKYRLVIGNATWTHSVPADPGAYSQAALVAGTSAAQREQLVAEHKILLKGYNDYLGAEEAGKELILYAAGDDALAPLKKLYIGFGDTSVLQMIDHLRQKTAIKMTTAQKHEYKTTGYNNPWDPTTSITAYFAQLDRFQVQLGDRGITTSDEEKTMAAGAQMWKSEMFTEEQMVAWENKTPAQQTWAALQTYFTGKWLERKQYSATTAKQSRFKEAALLAQETKAAEEEGESQALLFAMMQEQHDKQIAAIMAANKSSMDAMMERMNALAAGKGVGKENTKPTDNSKEKKPPQRKKHLCPHCKIQVLHKAKNCPELDENAHKRWTGWKSVNDTGKP